MEETIQLIPLDKIVPHPANRKIGGFDQAKLEQLAESIKAVGVQQPAVVRKMSVSALYGHDPAADEEEVYQLVAGERRWRASKLAGQETLPCVVRDLDDLTALKIQTIENLQRDDVHPLDEANGYHQLINQADYTIELLASDVGKSTSYIYQRLKLNSLIDEVRTLFVENKITAGHAILIARLTPEQQRAIVDEELFDYEGDVCSVRDLNEYIHNTIMLELSGCAWKLDDAALLPEAGSCQECPKRTGYQPELFADVCTGKKDYCTDRSCFKDKQARIVALKRAELEGQDVLEVLDSYVHPSEAPHGALTNWQWHECKKSDPGAKKILIVAGEKPGRVTYGTVNESKRVQSQESPAEKEKRKKQLQAAKKAEDARIARMNAVLDASLQDGMPLEALRLCMQEIWLQWSYDSCRIIAKNEGWKVSAPGNPDDAHKFGKKLIASMGEVEIHRLMLALVMSGEIKYPSYFSGKPETKRITALEKIFGVVGNDARKEKGA